MALTKGAARKQQQVEDTYQIIEVPESIPRDRWDRPLIKPKAGGEAIAYTRASTLGKAIDDTYHLTLWKLRTAVYGMSRRTELVAQASAVETNEGDDRKLLDEIVERAHEAGKGNVGADVGTALHKLSERADAGEDLSWLAPELGDAILAYLQQMKIFKVLASETFVACDEVQSAGSFDRVVQLLVDLEFNQNRDGKIVKVVIPAGTIMILDLKTGKLSSAKYWGPTYGVQQTVYACGEPYLPSGRISWEALLGDGMRPSTDYALILHVPGDSPGDAGLVVVDLEDGRQLADLAVAIRAARKVKSLLSDAWVAPMVIDQVEPAAIEQGPAIELDQAAQALLITIQTAPFRNPEGLDQLYEEHQEIWTAEHTAAAQGRVAELQAKAAEPVEDPPHVAKTKLMAALQSAQSEVEINGLYEIHSDVWADEHTTMAKARMREILAVAS